MGDTSQSDSFEFQAEVSRLLHLMVHSVYSESEIFLRELISNAADACDKRRYVAQTEANTLSDEETLAITITTDRTHKTLTVSDSGIGMSRDELIENLGTIARSGTARFMEHMQSVSGSESSSSAAPDLIGQFGVGFYSVFMVAERAEVLTRRAGEDQAWRWSSRGEGSFEISADTRAQVGTDIILYLRDDMASEYGEPARLSHIVRTYSDHIPVPVMVVDLAADKEEDRTPQQANSGRALWTRPKSEITDAEHKDFYHHVSHAFDDPWMTIHQKAEGVLSYTLLLYIPGSAPLDLYDSRHISRLKLYVKRVFITDSDADLVPTYLRFLRGVVDCEDLPLNISREMLQNNPVLQRLSRNITNKVLADLQKKADSDPEAYAQFWKTFGVVIKEGLTEDFERQKDLLALMRVKTTQSEAPVSLAALKERMKPEQKALYYIVGEDAEAIARSPHLEGFKARDVDVMLLSDPVDSFWTTAISTFDDIPLASVTQGAADLDAIAKTKQDEEPSDQDAPVTGMDGFISGMKTALGTAVNDVIISTRLTDSPVCLIASEGAADAHMERFLKKYRHMDMKQARILEINADHALIRLLAKRSESGGDIKDAAFLLLDQARLVEGEPLSDSHAFAKRLEAVMKDAYSGS